MRPKVIHPRKVLLFKRDETKIDPDFGVTGEISWLEPLILYGQVKYNNFQNLTPIGSGNDPILELLKNQQPTVIIQSVPEPVNATQSWNNSSFMNGGFAAHAEGGIFTKPHLGLVAESGPEVIIPTSDPSRGIPLLTAAANAMGLNNRARNAENAAPILARMALNERGSENYNEHANRNLRSDKPTQVKNNVNLRMEAVTTPVYLDGDMIGQFITRFLEHQDMRNGSPALA